MSGALDLWIFGSDDRWICRSLDLYISGTVDLWIGRSVNSGVIFAESTLVL